MYRKTYWEFGTGAKASSVSVHSTAISAGNFAAQDALRQAFEEAVDDVVIGNPGSEEFGNQVIVSKNPSLDPLSQRENRWLVSFFDNVSLLGGSFTIPTADLSLLGADGSEMASGAIRTALVDAVEAFVRSNAGNQVTVTSIKFVSR